MRNLAFILCLFLTYLITSQPCFCQAPNAVSIQNLEKDMEQLKKEVKELDDLNKAVLQKTQQDIELANKIISWSSLVLTILAVILVLVGGVAGYAGVKEFKNIRKAKGDLDILKEEMNKKIKEIEDTKKELQKNMGKKIKEIEDTKEKLQENIIKLESSIKTESKKTLEIIYLLNEGISRYHIGHLSVAIEKFDKVLEINPNDYEATCYLALSYIGQRKFKEGIEKAKKAIGLTNKPDNAHVILGVAYRYNEEFDNAIKSFENALKIDEKAETLNDLGYTYLRKGDIDDAIDTFKKSLEIKRKPTACCGLAKAYILKGKPDKVHSYSQETIILVEETIFEGTTWVWPYYNLAFSHFILKNEAECMAALQRALEKNKNQSIIEEQLENYKLMLDEEVVPQDLLEKCIDLIERALSDLEKYKF